MIHERDLQAKCLEWLKARDIYVINTHGDGWGGNGTPDLTACLSGRFIACELKVGENGLSGAQKIHRKRIIRNGGTYLAPYTLDEFIHEMEAILCDYRIRNPQR